MAFTVFAVFSGHPYASRGMMAPGCAITRAASACPARAAASGAWPPRRACRQAALKASPAPGAALERNPPPPDPGAHLLCHPTNIAFHGKRLFTANLGRWHVTGVATDTGAPALWALLAA